MFLLDLLKPQVPAFSEMCHVNLYAHYTVLWQMIRRFDCAQPCMQSAPLSGKCVCCAGGSFVTASFSSNCSAEVSPTTPPTQNWFWNKIKTQSHGRFFFVPFFCCCCCCFFNLQRLDWPQVVLDMKTLSRVFVWLRCLASRAGGLAWQLTTKMSSVDWKEHNKERKERHLCRLSAPYVALSELARRFLFWRL